MAWRYYDVRFIDGNYYYSPIDYAYYSMGEVFEQGKKGLPMPNTPTLKRTEPDGIELYVCRSQKYDTHNMFGVKEEKEEDEKPNIESMVRKIVASNEAIRQGVDQLVNDIRREIGRTKL
jgi:hypothetical protein